MHHFKTQHFLVLKRNEHCREAWWHRPALTAPQQCWVWRIGNPKSTWAPEPAQDQGWVTWTLGNYKTHGAIGNSRAFAKHVPEKQKKAGNTDSSSIQDIIKLTFTSLFLQFFFSLSSSQPQIVTLESHAWSHRHIICFDWQETWGGKWLHLFLKSGERGKGKTW